MNRCKDKQSRSIKPIESWGLDRSIFTVVQNPASQSKSGHVTHLTVKIYPVDTRMMAELNLSFRAGNLGEEVIADATIHFFYRDDRESAWTEPARWVAI